jgi:hypothetical protein
MNDLKKQFMEDREAVKGFEQRQDKSRMLTDDEIEDLSYEVGDLDAYEFDGTVESANRIRKQYKDYMDDMYQQYKMGKLDPKPGDTGRERLKYLQNQMEEMEMSGDKRLMNQEDVEELIDLEKRFEYLDLLEKAQDTSRKLSDEEILKLKELDDMGYADVLRALDKTKKAKGGLIDEGVSTLFMEK